MVAHEGPASPEAPWVTGLCNFSCVPPRAAGHPPPMLAHLDCLTEEGATSPLPQASLLGTCVKTRKDLRPDGALSAVFSFEEYEVSVGAFLGLFLRNHFGKSLGMQ